MMQEPTEPQLSEETEPEVVHDDIVKRLLDYQRRLREGLSEEPASTPEPPPVIDYAALEAGSVATAVAEQTQEAAAEPEANAAEALPMDPAPEPEASAAEEPVVVLQILDPEPAEADAPVQEEAGTPPRAVRAADMVAELRSRFQALAIEADERLAAIEAELRAQSEG